MSSAGLAEGSLLQDTYRVVRRIGRGGMGEVYEATHARLSGRYAVKLLLGETAAHPDALSRFRREAEVTSALRHPNIVQVIDFNCTAEGQPYLVMEYLEGQELSRELERVGRLPLARAAEILRQIVSALSATHHRGIVHRDLKPENVFLVRLEGEETDLVKVLDFGISKVKEATTRLTRESAVIGTVHYMSPEQALGHVQEIDARSDQFSLGAMAYQMLAGREPFWGDSAPAVVYQVVHKDPAPLSSVNPEVPPAVSAVIARAMAKRREDRFPGVRDFHQAFVSAAAGGVAELPAPVLPVPSASAERLTVAEVPAKIARLPARTTFGATTGEMLPAGTGRPRWRQVAIAAGVVAVALVAVLGLSGRPSSPRVSAPAPVAAAPPPAAPVAPPAPVPAAPPPVVAEPPPPADPPSAVLPPAVASPPPAVKKAARRRKAAPAEPASGSQMLLNL